MKETWFIYGLKNQEGTIFYIGRSRNPLKRFEAHRALYGKTTTLEMLYCEKCDLQKAIYLERFYIEDYLRKGFKLVNRKDNRGVEPRKPRSYKILDSVYKKALKKKPLLATFIEEVVTAIGEGKQVTISSKK